METIKMSNAGTFRNGSYTKTILVNKSAAETFDAIWNVRGWWSEEIDGHTDKVNEVFFYHYKDIHRCKIQLAEAIPAERLVYRVIENEFNFIADKTEWVGTNLIFDIVPEGGRTKVTFTHDGLITEYECYLVCNEAWSDYIGNSLKEYIETGKGRPNPKGEDGFNAALAKKWGLQPGR